MAIYLSVDGIRVAPKNSTQRPLIFNLTMPATEIRLISGHASPADITGEDDPRQLGVAVRGLRWQQGGKIIDAHVQSPSFIDGFHNLEFYSAEQGPFRWTNGNAALPPALFPPWHGETQLHVQLFLWAGSDIQASRRPEAVLLSAFESIGEDCELALAQRHYGVELPLTLLRWAGTTHEKLLRGLENRFDGLGDPDTTEVVWENFDYRLRTPYLSFHTSTDQPRDEAGIAEILALGSATLRLLRRKLLRDIADTRRIFVLASDDPSFGRSEMYRLHASLRTIGPASLLCVTQKRPPGTEVNAERLADGLYAGYLNKFVIPDGPFDEWLALCTSVLALHYAG